MKWKSDYELGNSEIDLQHRALIEKINIYKDNLSSADSNKGNILETLLFLVNYTNYHFAAEEKFMESINYPKLEEHKGIHIDIVNLLRSKIKRFKTGETNMNLEFYYFLSDWLNTHILHEDMQIKDFCLENSIEKEVCKTEFISINNSIEYIKVGMEQISINIEKSVIAEDDEKFRRLIFLEEYFERILSFINQKDLLKLLLSIYELQIVSPEELNVIYMHIDVDNIKQTYNESIDNYKSEIKKIISL